MTINDGIGWKHLGDLAPPEHFRLNVYPCVLAELLNGLDNGIQRIEQQEILVANSKPRPLTLSAHDTSSIRMDKATLDLEIGVMNGPASKHFEPKWRAIRQVNVVQLVARQCRYTTPRDKERMIVLLDRITLVSKSKQHSDTASRIAPTT
jgi:hypothetical protein